MSDADAEATETQVWLDFSKDCGYIAIETCEQLKKQYGEVGRMLGNMIHNPTKFMPRQGSLPTAAADSQPFRRND
jgi:hypothetical protein